jgi:penicillin-insensitive murein DD-endopeptidase
MRFPAALLLLTPLIALPALLAAQDAAPTPVAAAKEGDTGKAGKADATADAKTDAKTDAKAEAKPEGKPAAGKAKKAAKPPPTPAKVLFGAAKTPVSLAARSIGFYAKGCLAGAAALPIDGPAWQAMRLSRNRNWGHPVLIALVEKLAVEAKQHDGWPGLLVGDISQPRGGPMLTGHTSHQVGLDADVWFTPMPDRRLTGKEREDLSATSMLADDRVSVNPKVWSEAHVRLLKRAASYQEVERVLVHPAIKKAVCEATAGEKDKDRAWLSKVRAYWGHHYHFHIRIGCPDDSPSCQDQPSVGSDDGCGAELTRWLKLLAAPPRPAPPSAKPPPEKRPITLDQLPAECRTVLAGGPSVPAGPAKAEAKTPSLAAKTKPSPKKATVK